MNRRFVLVKVPAKINLALHVGGLDEAGYHQLGTVFQAISLYDKVTVTESDEPGLRCSGLGARYLPTDDRNLAWRAAELIAARHHITQPVHIHIRKDIPVAGGMAGGSADAAAALLACNHLWQLELPPEELAELAAELGSDVPFALAGHTALGTNRGDKLMPLEVVGQFHWVAALSYRGLSTPNVFIKFDALRSPGPTDISEGLLAALKAGDPHLAHELECELEPLCHQLRENTIAAFGGDWVNDD